jgi:hypothetical protein
MAFGYRKGMQAFNAVIIVARSNDSKPPVHRVSLLLRPGYLPAPVCPEPIPFGAEFPGDEQVAALRAVLVIFDISGLLNNDVDYYFTNVDKVAHGNPRFKAMGHVWGLVKEHS